ncbi:DEAD/DEAH box helicase [Abyssibacter sp.]|uniref:DEAD/DEAH box helicase n=1 Tax=Abyssibacter sp. TaxID=2320200 RepID=UPI003510FC94
MNTESSPSGFASLGLADSILATVAELGYTTPSPIQSQAIPYLLEGRDVLGMAQTGTGKTAAFALPLLTMLAQEAGTRGKQRAPSALILAPTRELAQQVAEAFETYAKGLSGCRVIAVYGGSPYPPQTRALRSGVDIVVGTPGRVMDHMRKGALDVSHLKMLVLDEADEMLRMGFIDDVEWVLSHTPDDRQIALFSATMPRPVARIANEHLNNPAEVRVKQATATATTIEQRYVMVHSGQKSELLARLLEVESPDAAMVFVRTKVATSEVADFLRERGLAAEALSGDLSQEQREQTVQRLRDGRIQVVVATDVAARGLDVERISHVFNYDMPGDPEVYVHRIGRTGRAGREGMAILFVQPREQRMLKLIGKVTRSSVEPMELPTVAAVNAHRLQALTERLQGHAAAGLDTYRELVAQMAESTGLAPADLAAALMAELNRGQPFLLREKENIKSPRAPQERGTDDKRGRRLERGQQAVPDGYRRYWIAVGREHNVKPGNIVGAIANEAGIEAGHIGRVELRERFSVVDLPEGMPREVFTHLKGVWVCGQKLSIRDFEERPSGAPSAKGKPTGGKPAGAKRKGAGKPKSKTKAKPKA